jgi:hypothetical protein
MPIWVVHIYIHFSPIGLKDSVLDIARHVFQLPVRCPSKLLQRQDGSRGGGDERGGMTLISGEFGHYHWHSGHSAWGLGKFFFSSSRSAGGAGRGTQAQGSEYQITILHEKLFQNYCKKYPLQVTTSPGLLVNYSGALGKESASASPAHSLQGHWPYKRNEAWWLSFLSSPFLGIVITTHSVTHRIAFSSICGYRASTYWGANIIGPLVLLLKIQIFLRIMTIQVLPEEWT